MNATLIPHPVYFLVRTKGQRRGNLTAIKDERTDECLACVFISAADAEEFMVANDLTFDVWRIFEVQDPVFVRSYCEEAMCDGVRNFVINPPPVIRGRWRTLPTERLRTWSWAAKDPLLVWAGCKVLPKVVET